ncbi:nucleolar protein 12 [Cloeon dipterum]|uniref:nucleolar protein 12 n=1 Tax=Cloeon dipterum TaxID=197152 RepID=UPI00321F66E6
MKNKGQGKIFRPKKAINRKSKVELVFDPDARRDFLTGFHKRKMARQKKAQEELAAELKAEKKRIKEEAKNLHNTMVVSHRPIPEVEELLGKEETFDFEQHSVSIKELSTAVMADDNFWIGENRTSYETNDDESNEPDVEDKKQLKSGKDIKKAVKKMATKQVQKSKAFQKKGKLNQKKQQKKSRMTQKQKKAKNISNRPGSKPFRK